MATGKRLIDANDLKTKAFAETETGEGVVYVQDIDEAPTVDAVEVVHGEWVFGGDGCVLCSVCGEEEGNSNRRNYCPNCGAKMDK